ncbi:amino acid ABC transporter, permease protein [Pseudomonas syringae pv. avellanae str. ISPaVe013]|uniref:amino acid ABC transporter permease n=1 Tax=Pseudomonas syringae TaxID=317 RepID=UPI00028D7B74|nr:amino acid ABC transporter permease [Pseudomonas syringae]EKG40169.1 amino acid ABC transporter, permease protein [Pseudomonas syringae pv. avellanae str. ISPaVe013]
MLQILTALLEGVFWTLCVTLGAFAIGVVLGAPLCAMRTAKTPVLRVTALSLVLILRSIPPIVWLFFIFFGIGGGFFGISPLAAAILGLGLITAAQMSEVYRGALGSIPPGQYEAAHVLNLSPLQRFKDVILAQMVRIVIPSATTYLIGLLKDSAVASTIGVGDVTFQAYQATQQTFKGLQIYSMAALLYLAMSLPVAFFSRWVGYKLTQRIVR